MNRTRTSKNAKRLLVWLLMLTMVFSLLPMAAFADEAVAEPVVEEPVQDEQPSAEPTTPAEPSEEPEEPSVEPTQEPTEEPVDSEEPIDAIDVLAAEADLTFTTKDGYSYVELSDTNTANLPSGSNYRAVMLDCGRKYFTVGQIEKLIDTMAQYGYNQLQLSFGNGGCRLLLDDMDLTYVNSTLTTKYVQGRIKAGNSDFNGDESYLTESDMTAVINYATKKGIDIVPMLNMPGHAKAINYVAGGTSDSLNTSDDNARKVAFALLKKYVEYFKLNGCKYFHFGSDESSETGTSMSTFLASCANIIANSGMRPRAFNDETNLGTNALPTFVQITFWLDYSLNNSKTATELSSAGYQLINAHGNWYYVVSDGNAENGKSVQYASNVRVELPLLKKDNSYKYTWPNSIDNFYDNTSGQGSEVSTNKGTMFCMWFDNSTGMPADDIISENQTWGALYQIEQLAQLYWPNDIKDSTGTDTDKEQTVNIKVGETKTYDTTAGAGDYITGNNAYIASAKVAEVEATTASITEITNEDDLVAGKKYLILNNRQNKVLTNGTSTAHNTNGGLELDGEATTNNANWWSIVPADGNFYIRYNNDGYLTIGNNTSKISTTTNEVTISYNTAGGYWTISEDNYYLNDLGRSVQAGGWKDNAAPTDEGSRWTIYEVVEEQDASKTLTITGTGEEETTVTIGNVKYTIKVTAPAETIDETLGLNETLTLPTGAQDISITDDEGIVTVSDGKIVAGETAGNAVVTCVIKNAGGYVTAKYTYNITVSAIDFDNVADLPVQLWITNTWVGENGAPTSLETKYISAKDAYKEEGVLLSEFVPKEGYKKDGSTSVKVVYWKGVALSGITPDEGKTDYSNGGNNFTRIRYWGNSWQYQFGTEWKNIDTTTDTVVAYYLQINNVSPEITTGTKDYGNPPTAHPGYSSGNGYNMTAFAVVYPDGTLSRTEQQMYETGMIRGFWGGTSCNIGTIYAENNSTYKVSKITVTWGANKLGITGDNWYTGNKTGTYGKDWGVTWEKNTNSAGEEWYAETTYWKDGDSEIPMINGKELNLNLTKEKNAVLILIYLEVVETENTLNIIYWDDNGNKQITTNPMPIPVVVTPTTTFINGITQNSTVNKGTFTLDDDAYILNSSGAKQGFNKNLSTVPGVTGVYLSGMYQYASADISDDGMTLTLHFNLKSATMEKTYVVDFGLPLEVPADEFDITNVKSIQKMSLEKNAVKMSAQGNYGIATIADDFSKVTYELNRMLNGKATIPLYVTFNDGTTLEYRVNIIPASNVYYEDSFATLENGKGAALNAVWTPSAVATAKQALSELGSDKNVYGYDKAYENSTTFSMGSAAHVTVTKAMADAWTADSAWPTATFTFKGTGFDIISLTSNKSGVIAVDVVGKEEASGNEVEKNLMVNNYYGYTYNETTKKWEVVDTNSETALYQIPVMKVDDLEYGTYTVTIKPFYYAGFDVKGTETNEFYLDAIRIYNPLGKNYADYAKDGEGYPQYIKLRDEVVNENVSLAKSKLLFIDGGNTAEVKTYANIGPNNEVYLAKGQAISFKLPANIANLAEVQIGAKAPNGSASMIINGAETPIKTATEMYYTIMTADSYKQNVITITNNADAILSLTNLKITYKAENKIELEALTDSDAEEAVAVVRALFAAPVDPEPTEPEEPEKPEPEAFKPERFDWEWSKNVRKGGRAILTVKTSTDVDYILVDGVKYDKYITRTERIGWGRNAQRVTYREFIYMTTVNESGLVEIPVKAVNAAGIESEPVVTTLNVKASSPIRDWIGGLFGRWF